MGKPVDRRGSGRVQTEDCSSGKRERFAAGPEPVEGRNLWHLWNPWNLWNDDVLLFESSNAKLPRTDLPGDQVTAGCPRIQREPLGDFVRARRAEDEERIACPLDRPDERGEPLLEQRVHERRVLSPQRLRFERFRVVKRGPSRTEDGKHSKHRNTNLQLDELVREPTAHDAKPCDADGQRKPPWAGAAGIQKQDAVPHLCARAM